MLNFAFEMGLLLVTLSASCVVFLHDARLTNCMCELISIQNAISSMCDDLILLAEEKSQLQYGSLRLYSKQEHSCGYFRIDWVEGGKYSDNGI